MICCLETPFTDSKRSYYSQVAVDEKLLPDSQKNGRSYPGLRRTPLGPPAPPSSIINNNNNHTEQGLIAVTVPPGVLPGQEIHVRRPDGKAGLVEVVVPAGMKEGSVFHVKAPPPLP